MAIDQYTANVVALVMAAISVAFMIPALFIAYKIRKNLSKAILILAASRNLYRYLFTVLGFAAIGSVAHLVYHIGEFQSIPVEIELITHIVIDSSFILVSISLFMTFQTAYGMLQDSKGKNEIEKMLKDSTMRPPQKPFEKNKP